MYYSVSQARFLLGVCSTTIRRWDKNKMIRCIRTLGNHRRIHKSEIERIKKGKKRRYARKKRGVATYARVSSHEQKKKGDLDRQQELLREFCEDNNLELVAEIKDVASGLNTKRKGIMRLCKLVTKGKISEVIVSYRLTRFGFEYLEDFFISYGVKVRVIKARQSPSVQQEMVDDMIAIITSFSGKIHGLRSRGRKLEKKILIKCQPVP